MSNEEFWATHSGGIKEPDGILLGYMVEKIEPSGPGKVGYKLHGPKVTYTLMRHMQRPHLMYALNSVGNICGIKGNYHFSDKAGALDCAS